MGSLRMMNSRSDDEVNLDLGGRQIVQIEMGVCRPAQAAMACRVV